MDTITIGRTVWTKFDGETVPAVVTKVWEDGTINATAFRTDGTFTPMARCEWNNRPTEGKWTWPDHLAGSKTMKTTTTSKNM